MTRRVPGEQTVVTQQTDRQVGRLPGAPDRGAEEARMSDPVRPRTLGELRRSGYRPRTVREEVHANLVRKLEAGEALFPGIVGYQDTVIPELANALLAGQNVIVLGERGQAKSRLIRAMVSLLDAEIPVVAGSELNDSPFAPVSPAAKRRVAEDGDEVALDWLPREARYGEKLATPDVSMADLIGDVDPIKVAEGRYLSDELTIHYGLVPRTNRGIFCVNELPDLPERIQVGLFNLMEERDVQIKGYRIRLPLDLLIFATANPEDYTNRGRIITPLKDRFGAQVRTHYPRPCGTSAPSSSRSAPGSATPRRASRCRTTWPRSWPRSARWPARAGRSTSARASACESASPTTRPSGARRSAARSGSARRWPPPGSPTCRPSSPRCGARSSWSRSRRAARRPSSRCPWALTPPAVRR